MLNQIRAIFLGGQASEVFREIPLVASLLYYSFTIFLARLLRTTVRKTLPQPYQNIAADAVMAFAACACSLENTMICQAYGWTAYGVVLFIVATWFGLTVRDGSIGNPCGNMISYMYGVISLPMMMVRMLFQLLGGLASYRYARYFWYLELTQGHGMRYSRLHCIAHLTVSAPAGFTVEFSAVFFDVLLALTTFTPFFLVEMCSKIFLCVLVVIACIHTTGMYMNPVNASNQTFGCEGASPLEHIFVYWAGPLIAAALAVSVHRYLSNLLKTHRYKLSSEFPPEGHFPPNAKQTRTTHDNNENDVISGAEKTANGTSDAETRSSSLRLRNFEGKVELQDSFSHPKETGESFSGHSTAQDISNFSYSEGSMVC